MIILHELVEIRIVSIAGGLKLIADIARGDIQVVAQSVERRIFVSELGVDPAEEHNRV